MIKKEIVINQHLKSVFDRWILRNFEVIISHTFEEDLLWNFIEDAHRYLLKSITAF